ncbi:MAG TPA: ATP-binding protein [Clostridia bacterium]|jgi:DNA replication protein DnaC|nr:ATP-binding protein [Clostridia bacterium]
MSIVDRALRRRKKIAEWEANLEELYKKYPRLGEIAHLLAQISLEVVYLQMGQGKMGLTLEELNKKRTALLNEKKALFEKYALPENIEAVKWDCPLCEDRGFLNVGEKCACLLAEESQQRWELSGLGPRQKKQTFNSFSLKWYEDKKRYRTILEECVSFAENICRGKAVDNLLLCGNIGTGKTHLCSAIANYVLQAGISVAYLKIGILMDLIREAKYNFDSQVVRPINRLQSLYQVDLLIIDDLGTEVVSDFVREQLFYLIDERLNFHLPWIISTNLSLNEIGTLYEDRLSDRILGTSTVLKFTGASIRQQLKVLRG